jgi:hypothetical protein
MEASLCTFGNGHVRGPLCNRYNRPVWGYLYTHYDTHMCGGPILPRIGTYEVWYITMVMRMYRCKYIAIIMGMYGGLYIGTFIGTYGDTLSKFAYIARLFRNLIICSRLIFFRK